MGPHRTQITCGAGPPRGGEALLWTPPRTVNGRPGLRPVLHVPPGTNCSLRHVTTSVSLAVHHHPDPGSPSLIL